MYRESADGVRAGLVHGCAHAVVMAVAMCTHVALLNSAQGVHALCPLQEQSHIPIQLEHALDIHQRGAEVRDNTNAGDVGCTPRHSLW